MRLLGFPWWGAFFLAMGILLLFFLPAIITKEKRGITTNMNLLTTMLLGGFWHGASWNFIIWGALHGMGLAVHKIWVLLTGKKLRKINSKIWYKTFALLITFHFVCFGWVFFHARDFNTAADMLYQITHNFSFSVWPGFFGNYWPVLLMMLLAYLLHAIPDDYADKIIGRFQRIPLRVYIGIFFIFVILYGYFKSSEPVMPIYLQF
jgi:hypothetical protein